MFEEKAPARRVRAATARPASRPRVMFHVIARTRCAAAPADHALDGEQLLLVLGDLNAAPDGHVVRPLDDVLTDPRTAGAEDPASVTLPSSRPAAPVEAEEQIHHRIDHMIDHVGVQQGQMRQGVLASNALNGIYPSDHRAVVCDVSWHETPEA